MNIVKINETAFHKYLLSIGPDACYRHILKCAKQGGRGNMVWELFEFYNESDEHYIKAAINTTYKIFNMKR
jgi:hypothetical protein